MSQETQSQTSTEQSAPAAAPTLTLTDLSALQKIIEITNSRGAFKPEELQAVGAIYQKLTMFLLAATAQQVPGTEELQNQEGNQS